MNITTEQHLRINRLHQRLEIAIPCEVGLTDGDLMSVDLLNLSIGGLKFQCGLETINRLLPEEQRIPGMVMDVELNVRLRLAAGSGRTPLVNTRARLAHYERLAQDCFHVGIEFIDLEKNPRRKLEDYINDTLGELETSLAGKADE